MGWGWSLEACVCTHLPSRPYCPERTNIIFTRSWIIRTHKRMVLDLLSPHKKRPSTTDMSGRAGSEVSFHMTGVVMCHVLQGHITVGYRGSFAIGRGDMSTTGFRKLTRILVCGKSALCREVFRVGTTYKQYLISLNTLLLFFIIFIILTFNTCCRTHSMRAVTLTEV